MKKLNKIILAAFFPLAIAPVTASSAGDESPAIWENSVDTTWKNSAGECWRSSYWTPALATEECDPALFKKAEVAAPKVAEAAAPTQAAPPPVRTELQKVSFSAEDLFDFDSAALRPEGKAKLDNLVAELNVTTNEQIFATGYADRIGREAYNQQLSERRAEAVRDYLVSKGIPENQVRAEGKGEAEPVTIEDDCIGQSNSKLITCLQPDRRVEIDVIATKEVQILAN